MRLYPWKECLVAIDEHLQDGKTNVYQQWICEHCGVKQTMETPNVIHETGSCEECKKITNIKKRGMNYMLHRRLG